MAFSASIIEAVYKEIQDRKAELGRLSLIEFDEEEYRTLLSRAREIIPHYESWPDWKQQRARVVFLAFACEYLRRNKYINDNKFWDDFEDALRIRGRKYYKFITEELLWRTYHEEGIELKYRSNNAQLYVESLVSEVHTSQTTREKVIDFFRWYYQHYAGSEVTRELIQLYEKKGSFYISEKAIPALNQDCQTLACIIEYASENNLLLAQSNREDYHQEIIAALGPLYDLAHIRLIRSKDSLHNLIIELENHYTPEQFLRKLEAYTKGTVQPPKGEALPVSTARQIWRTKTFSYGLYLLNNEKFRVVPFAWLWLETIAQWPYEQVISLRRGGYLGYKKSQSFQVKIGARVVEGRRCILPDGKQCYVWVGAVPRGEPLVVDGCPYQGSGGIDWKISLYLGYDEYLQPTIEIVCDSLKAYFPGNPRSRIAIRTSQGYEQVRNLNLDGVVYFSLPITLPLEDLPYPEIVSLYLDEELLDSKTLSPDPAYLFSCQTHECIPVGTKREWGEKRYYLFTTSPEDITAQGIDLEQFDAVFGSYTIYNVIWEDNNQPFQLQVRNISWNFQQQHYLFIQMKPQLIEEVIQLEHHQMHHFSQSIMYVISNIDLVNSSITCQVFSPGELILEIEARLCLQRSGNDQYLFTPTFLEKLNAVTVGQKCYERYTIRFLGEGKVLEQSTIALIPALDITSPQIEQLMLENEILKVKVSSPHLSVWDPAEGKVGSSANISIRPKLSVRPTGKSTKRGIIYLAPQFVTAPLTFPAIGETIEIKVCPKLFGLRLYEKKDKADRYYQVDVLDYYTLKTAALYVFTNANYKVSLYVDNQEIQSNHADTDGDTIFELEALKENCHAEWTTVTVVSRGQKSTFLIRWTPLIHQLFVKEDRVHIRVNGPQNAGIILRLVDNNNQLRDQQIIGCKGKPEEVSLTLPPIESAWGQCYLMPAYYLADGTKLPSAWQWRLARHDSAKVVLEWLRVGIGISDKELLQILHVGGI